MPQVHTDGDSKVAVSLETEVTFVWEAQEKEILGSSRYPRSNWKNSWV